MPGSHIEYRRSLLGRYTETDMARSDTSPLVAGGVEVICAKGLRYAGAPRTRAKAPFVGRLLGGGPLDQPSDTLS